MKKISKVFRSFADKVSMEGKKMYEITKEGEKWALVLNDRIVVHELTLREARALALLYNREVNAA